MNYQVDITALATSVLRKRGVVGLFEMANALGKMKPASLQRLLSRIERRQVPSLPTFLALCNWLEIPPAQLLRDLHALPAAEPALSISVEELASIEVFLGVSPSAAYLDHLAAECLDSPDATPSQMLASQYLHLLHEAEEELQQLFAAFHE